MIEDYFDRLFFCNVSRLSVLDTVRTRPMCCVFLLELTQRSFSFLMILLIGKAIVGGSMWFLGFFIFFMFL